jgi:predicted RNA-binding Zn-ribbon protein involved in translation (DUF1610 family)
MGQNPCPPSGRRLLPFQAAFVDKIVRKGFMIVGCSQCGAKINRVDENRFFTCPFCGSSLVLEGGQAFPCFIMEHERNDLWARALFYERLRRAGITPNHGMVPVEFVYIPFWVIRGHDGSIVAHPAAETHHQDLSSIKVPPGRLVFYEKDTHPNAPVVALSVPLDRALGGWGGSDFGRVDLVYLPVYWMQSTVANGRYNLAVVGDSSRLYSGTVPSEKTDISVKSLFFFVAAGGLFAALGILIHDVYVRAAAIGAAGLICFIVSPLILGRRQ